MFGIHRKPDEPIAMPPLAFQYRLYPTPSQETPLRQTLSVCRAVYNSLLYWRRHPYEV